jgi:hypothetical protein
VIKFLKKRNKRPSENGKTLPVSDGLSNAVQIYERVKLHFYGINYMLMKYKDKINCNKQLIIEMKMNFLRFFLSYSHVPRKVH